MRLSILTVAAVSALALAACGDQGGSGTREGIWAAGSSTVFPFTTRVAENFARNTGGAMPRVESLGTGGGIQAFCQGVGPQTPDIANASRRMKPSEYDLCAQNGVTEIIEIKIGFDGLVIATARDGADFAFQGADLYLALAKDVPGGDGFIANPNTSWDQVRSGLPSARILVYGPPPTSGTRDSWLELAMAPAAKNLPTLAALAESDEDAFEARAHTLREDGVWVDSGENDNAIVQTLTRTPGSVGVFGYSFLEQNSESVKAASVNGVYPTLETISSGEYPISRSMYIYVKKAHIGVTPGLDQFVAEFVSDAASGPGGYLQDRGLVPLPEAELVAQREAARAHTPMARPE
ncbi:substrate-binding domain-containing protein [Brevundimonas sp. A19_0]|uniref:substrate-binding domain-containing protein n=1 Tax=Brevundimonas sp. A19_0 TaxID=2821087 RepID=UPI001AD9ADD9|nr:substrate-binding domain-containing protein [Brevundimonas sp. A19_0]MBO9501314.1 substrate-binding domain-containing protein [Brevundimonas sp. A19_0]